MIVDNELETLWKEVVEVLWKTSVTIVGFRPRIFTQGLLNTKHERYLLDPESLTDAKYSDDTDVANTMKP
jgi:hypothetical protein